MRLTSALFCSCCCLIFSAVLIALLFSLIVLSESSSESDGLMIIFFESFVLIFFFLSPSCSVTKNLGDFDRVGGDFVPFFTFPKNRLWHQKGNKNSQKSKFNQLSGCLKKVQMICRISKCSSFLPISPSVIVVLVLISLSPFLVTKTRLSDCFDLLLFSVVSPKSPLFRFEPVRISVESVVPFDFLKGSIT